MSCVFVFDRVREKHIQLKYFNSSSSNIIHSVRSVISVCVCVSAVCTLCFAILFVVSQVAVIYTHCTAMRSVATFVQMSARVSVCAPQRHRRQVRVRRRAVDESPA